MCNRKVPKFLVVSLWAAASITVFGRGLGFEGGPLPSDWKIVSGESASGDSIKAGGTRPLVIRTAPFSLPGESEILFRIREGGLIQLVLEGSGTRKLDIAIQGTQENRISLTVKSDGEPLPTVSDSRSARTRRYEGKTTGRQDYGWLFRKVGPLWEEPQQHEIGSSYERLETFAEKIFVLRIVNGPGGRQVWLDGRLVAEDSIGGEGEAELQFHLRGTAEIVAVRDAPQEVREGFQLVDLRDYERAKSESRPGKGKLENVKVLSGSVPILLPSPEQRPIDLRHSLYRFRNVVKAGFGVPYVRANESWAGAFEVDPARFAFRVPNRQYAATWLVVSVEESEHSVPKGTLRWYREQAGYPADTEFEVSEEAVAQGQVRKMDLKDAQGRDLYLVRVPVDTQGFAGLADLVDFPLNFEISKPVSPMRGYPDPVYYSSHPAGPPSSLQIHAITLEEAPYRFEVHPEQFSYVFQDPEEVRLRLSAKSLQGNSRELQVKLRTEAFGEDVETTESLVLALVPGTESIGEIVLKPEKYGWHSLTIEANDGGHAEVRRLSFVRLPPNQRSMGDATNETRFGAWGSLHAHLTPFHMTNSQANEEYLRMLLKLGVRRVGFVPEATTMEQIRRLGFLPQGTRDPNFAVRLISRQSITETDLDDLRRLNIEATAPYAENWPTFNYYYGGEWQISPQFKYGQDPRYTGEGARDLNEDELEKVRRHMLVMETAGRALRDAYPGVRLILQWGAPRTTLAYMMQGFPKELVDHYGMDAPMFELLPELSCALGSIHDLWGFRREVERLGWPQHEIYWREGPFFPTQPGALKEEEQSDNMVRYFLAAMAYGVSVFDGSVKPYDAASYYGAEHYGAGIFHRVPYANPKPAVAALATLTSMICGADPRPTVFTGIPTTYCAVFERKGEWVQALWRVRGVNRVAFSVEGSKAMITDAMGNARTQTVQNGRLEVEIGQSPLWISGVRILGDFSHGTPEYSEKPEELIEALPQFQADNWRWETTPDPWYEKRHWAVIRTAEPQLSARFVDHPLQGGGGVEVTLPLQSQERPLAIRYGKLTPLTPFAIPGKPRSLGLWVQGNAGWGRIAFRLRDAAGEIWTSTGMRDEWNADDLRANSFVSFEGWRFLRIPLPSNTPYDSFREWESSDWGSEGGDHIADYPMQLEAVYVEARNEVPVLGEMVPVPDRSFVLGPLFAEYESALEQRNPGNAIPRLVIPPWAGPKENPIAKLETVGAEPRPVILGFREPAQAADGRRMHIDFDAAPEATYRLYVSKYPDGRGADLVASRLQPGGLVSGLRPDVQMYLFLVATLPNKAGDSKPSAAFPLVTRDNFREK